MTAWYIQAQTLTLTKSHEERIGPLAAIAKSLRIYGYDDPQIVFSDDPIKVGIVFVLIASLSHLYVQDKQLLFSAFPSLSKNTTPIAAAYGLQSFNRPSSVKITVLSSSELVETVIGSFSSALDLDANAHQCWHMDTEYNISRKVGVSILTLSPESDPNSIYLLPVCNFSIVTL